MSKFEIIAVVPEAASPAPLPELDFVTYGGITVVLIATPQPKILLPRTRRSALMTAASRQFHLEACMQVGPVLPFRPAFYASKAEIKRLIQANEPLFKELLAKYKQLVQFQVSVEWNASGVLHHYRDSPELSPLFVQSEIAASDLQLQLKMLSQRLIAEMVERLEAVTTQMLALPLEEGYLVNAAVLLKQGDIPKLDDAVQQIDDMWTAGLSIRQIGPAPVASFALLSPQEIPASAVYAAQKMLKTPLNGDHDLARKTALRLSPENAAAINEAQKILSAASRLPQSPDSFHLCKVLAEGASLNESALEVA